MPAGGHGPAYIGDFHKLVLHTKRLPIVLLLFLCFVPTHGETASAWPEWDRFAADFIDADGRVIDKTFEQKTTSEGQSYALFFALVANDRPAFERVLNWTSLHLAQGKLGEHRPAWHWGFFGDGKRGIKDPNSAADADLWMAYALLEAARLWNAPEYARTGHKLLKSIARHEVTDSGKAGLVLLPGPFGFQLSGGRTRIDPSYLAPFQFHYFAKIDPKGPWRKIWENYMRLAPQIFAGGIAPDLCVVDAAGKVLPDSEREPSGSYDAIRVYLWAGMSGKDGEELVRLLTPYAALIRDQGKPPEKVDPRSGKVTGGDWAPVGFSAAVLPFLHALGDISTLEKQQRRLRRERAKTRFNAQRHYYNEVLRLFGEGWMARRFHFDGEGKVVPDWTKAEEPGERG